MSNPSIKNNEPLLGNNVVNQIAFVVHDIEKAAEVFGKLLGIPTPQWFLTGDESISKVVFNGKPTKTQNKLVFIDTPSVQIELIEPDQHPSTMREFLNEVGEGIHHIAFDVDSMKGRLKVMDEHNYPVIQTGEFTSSEGRYAYVDTLETHKTLVELLERDEPQPNDGKVISENAQGSLLKTNTVKQLGIVVRDIEKAANVYCEFLGVEKPNLIHAQKRDITQVVFDEKETIADAKFMFIQTPFLEIELIEPGEAPSTWKQHLDQYGEGVHHIAFIVESVDEGLATFKEHGYPAIQTGNFYNGKGKYAYVDTTSDYKVIIELLEKFS